MKRAVLGFFRAVVWVPRQDIRFFAYRGTWFSKWFGVFLVMLGELAAVAGLVTWFMLDQFGQVGGASGTPTVQWVIDHADSIARFINNVQTYEYYAIGSGIAGIIIVFVGFILLVLAGRKMPKAE